ncbi:hypothetical protein ABIF78_008931 [Bradyrhizobium japonicum]
MISPTLSTRNRSGSFGRPIMITGQAEHAGRVDLGVRTIAAGIAGDDPRDAACAHHLQLTLKREWSTRHDHVGSEGQGCLGRIDETQRVGMLWLRRERRDVLAADGEEHFSRRLGQRGDRGVDVVNFDPVVAGRPGPGCALQRNQLRAGFRAGLDRVAAHLGGEGVRRVDHMRDAFAANIAGKPAHAAEATDAGRQRLIGGRAGSAAIGIHGVDARACDFRGEQARIGGSAQNEGARHG